MNVKPKNVHGTAFRINKLGILCVGTSGSGKSELAFSMFVEAQRWGADAALIADDQVFISIEDDAIIATRPDSIANLIELRGSGILKVKSEEQVVLTHVVTLDLAEGNERIPPENERYEFTCGHTLPLIRVPPHSLTPYAKFSSFVEQLVKEATFGQT